ncbi:ATP synthase F1 subunit gamma [Bacteriovoracaceae bacterium]|nr:ATP synthase F1 subunit gamma [Bacteriovoracaceae bacterium]
MANIKDLKKRIKTTKSTFKITKAMKLVSAAKMAKAQQRIVGLRPYVNELDHSIKIASSLNTEYTHPYLKANEENKNAFLLVVSSDKGLCGSYNNQIVKTARQFIAENNEYNFKTFFIGKKAKEILKKEVNFGEHFVFEKADPAPNEIRKITNEFAEQFTNGEIGKVFVLFNKFNSAISFTTTPQQILPMSTSEEEKEKFRELLPYDFKYEPTAQEMLDDMIPESLFTSVYASVLDAIAAEHGSRMSAMENASKNCKEMIKKLTLKANKLRQAAITTELIEVVSGAESLNN